MRWPEQEITIDQHTVVIRKGERSQTVTIFRSEKRDSPYLYKLELKQQHWIKAEDFRQFASVDAVVNWLKQNRQARVQAHAAPPRTVSKLELAATFTEGTPSATDEVWIELAVSTVEHCLKELLYEFLEIPYLHRVETSMHARIFSLLSLQPIFSQHYSLDNGKAATQVVHKEWPENLTRPEKNGIHGKFDFAILSPDQLNRSTVKAFDKGAITPIVAMEVGLNEDTDHLLGDYNKLQNSKVKNNYIVHLSRSKRNDLRVLDQIDRIEEEHSVKICYARVGGGTRHLKLFSEKIVHEA